MMLAVMRKQTVAARFSKSNDCVEFPGQVSPVACFDGVLLLQSETPAGVVRVGRHLAHATTYPQSGRKIVRIREVRDGCFHFDQS